MLVLCKKVPQILAWVLFVTGILCEGVAGFVDDGGEEVLFQTKILVNPQSEPGRV